MSILSDREILEALEVGDIVIDPPLQDPRTRIYSAGDIPIKERERLQPATIDLRLGPRFGTLSRTVIDRYGPDPEGPDVVWDTFSENGHRFYSKEFLLCATLESITIKARDIVGILCGKSTLARDGLQVEAAGLADPGWSGNLTLELFNMGSATLILRAGQPICQIYFVRTEKPVMLPYGHKDLGSHYQGATTAQAGYAPVLPATPAD